MNYLPYCPKLPPGFLLTACPGTQSFIVHLEYGRTMQTRQCDDWQTANMHKAEAVRHGGQGFIFNRNNQLIG